jgi:hypothetical protein
MSKLWTDHQKSDGEDGDFIFHEFFGRLFVKDIFAESLLNA